MAFAEYYDKIEDYIKGRLPEAEQKAFEGELASNPALAKEVAFQREVMQATGEQEVIAYRQMIERIIAETPISTSRPPRSRRWWILISAFVLVAGFVIAWQFPGLLPKVVKKVVKKVETEIFKQEEPIEPESSPLLEEQKTPPTPEKPIANEEKSQPQTLPDNPYMAMAKELYKERPYEIRLRTVPDPNSEETTLQKAEQAYLDSNYVETARLLAKLVEGHTFESSKLRAHAYFRSGQYALAAQDFQFLRTGRYQYNAEWFLLLCYLAQLPESRQQFDTLAGQITNVKTHSFRAKTLELLGALK